MSGIGGLWDQLVLAVCRPPRDLYAGEDDLVGGRTASFRLGKNKYYRQDVQLVNPQGQKLQASHYRPCLVASSDGRLPCVVYCHCNSGSRRDAEEILYHLLPKGITVFSLDFAGSGMSEGQYVTLGAREVDDLASAVEYLRDEGSTSTIALWGRSMGAVTALLYSQRDPSIAGMVLDSPFSRLSDLMMELATDQQLRIPRPLVKVALAMMRRSVRKRAGFNIEDVAPLDKAAESFIPALFGHACEDTFVNKHHSERLYAAHSGDKNLITFDGDHNSARPEFFYDSALIFLMQALRVHQLVGPVDVASPEDMDLPTTLPAAGSGEAAFRGWAPSPRPSPTGAAPAALDGAGSPPTTPGGTVLRQLSPPWDVAMMPGRRASQEEERAGERRDGGAIEAPAGESHGEAYHDEEAALQRALEMSLRDLELQSQLSEERVAVREGAGSPLRGGSSFRFTPAGAPLSREDEESMLAQAIAESLRMSAEPQQAQQGSGEQQEFPGENALLGQQEDEARRQLHAGRGGGEDAGASDRCGASQLGRGVGAAGAQGSASQHAQQEASAARSASLGVKHAFSDAVAAAATNLRSRGAAERYPEDSLLGRGETGGALEGQEEEEEEEAKVEILQQQAAGSAQ